MHVVETFLQDKILNLFKSAVDLTALQSDVAGDVTRMHIVSSNVLHNLAEFVFKCDMHMCDIKISNAVY